MTGAMSEYMPGRLILKVSIALVAVAMAAPCECSTPPDAEWIQSKWFDEEFFTIAQEPDARIHVNAPHPNGNRAPQTTRLIIYALPNGNTIEQTLGCRTANGLDWHFDIQHVAAQVRLLRTLDARQRIVLICAEATGLSWPNWRRTHRDANATIANMVESWRSRFGADDCKITLAAHSGGGSFLFGAVEGTAEIPSHVDRIAFLDANYAFDATAHADKLIRWLTSDGARRLIALAYDDREIMLDGKKVVSPTGGTFRATARMHEAFAGRFPLTSAENSPFLETTALNGRLRSYVHLNPQNKILHTALVGDMNGLVHVQTLGTPHEKTWGQFGGPRAYQKWIQPEPTTSAFEPALGVPGTPRAAAVVPQWHLPQRRPGAMAGGEFARSVAGLSLGDREAAILREVTSGNFPEFLRQFTVISIRGMVRVQDENVEREVTASLHVMPDYLAVGSDADFVRMPMTPQTAQRIANSFGFVLPTRKMVDAIDHQADIHMEPHPLTENRESVATFLEHHRTIERMRAGNVLGLLITGIKKDIVLSPRIFERPQRVAIYGWRQRDGQPIQPLSTVHSHHYVDYSHGVRLVLNKVEVNGQILKISDLLPDPDRCGLVSDEGPMNPPKYPLE
jgi:hypothetical protein